MKEQAMISHRIEPHHERTCLQDLRPGKTKTSLLSYRDQLFLTYLDLLNACIILSGQRTTKALFRLRECAG